MLLLDLLFPKYCINCGKGGKYFCQNCLNKVQVLNRFDPVSKTFSIFKYEGVIRKGITKIKYNFAYDIAEELANICAVQILNCSPALLLKINNCVLVPIPLYQSRQRWRGFNQSEKVGKLIAEKLSWGFNKDILMRPVGGQNQVGLRGFDRVRNIRGKYAVNPEAKLYQNITYIIFDDVATTGSTLKEAIRVLKKSGSSQVFGLTVAQS